MRLARNQEPPQLVADAVDRAGRAVVDERQFVVERGRLDLHDIGAGVLDLDVDTDRLVAADRAFVDRLPVDAYRDLGALAGDALIVQPVGDGLHLAYDAEAGRSRDRNP